MDEAAIACVQANVRHFAGNTEEDQIAWLQLCGRHSARLPKLQLRSTWHADTGRAVGKVH